MNEHNILGAILAGGQSKRMGQDKLFLELNNRKLIEYTICLLYTSPSPRDRG